MKNPKGGWVTRDGAPGVQMTVPMRKMGRAMRDMGRVLGPPVPRGSVGDIRMGVHDLVHDRIPCGVYCAGLVLSVRGGWRFKVLQACMWVLRKTGHEVIR